MICPNCGRQISDTAKFCSGCGMPIDSSAAENERVTNSAVISENADGFRCKSGQKRRCLGKKRRILRRRKYRRAQNRRKGKKAVRRKPDGSVGLSDDKGYRNDTSVWANLSVLCHFYHRQHKPQKSRDFRRGYVGIFAYFVGCIFHRRAFCATVGVII